MFEAHGLNFKSEIAVRNVPFGRERFSVFPTATTLFTAVINGVDIGVRREVVLALPNNLRVGTKKAHLAPSFELHTVARSDYFVIFPTVRNSHSALKTSAYSAYQENIYISYIFTRLL